MSNSVDILFLDSQDLEQPSSLQKILQVFIDSGFALKRSGIKDDVFVEGEALPDLGRVFDAAYRQHNLSFYAFHPKWNFEIFQQIAWGEQQMGAKDRAYIRTSTQSTMFWREGNDNLQSCSFLLEVSKQLYYLLNPTFGWVDLYFGWTTTHDDVESLSLRHLYWANFFSPKFVKKLGRKKLLNAPAWKVEELTDGGIFYLLAPHLGLTNEAVPTQDVRSYFGVANVR